jgi:transcription elongation factor GreA
MSDDIVYLTAEGLAKLKEELQMRIEVKRPEIAERLHAAIKMGDLKENADYHVAKEDQAFNEGRINTLKNTISSSQLIRDSSSTSVVRLGSTVTIAEVGFEDEEETYRIVGAQEADPGNGYISNVSPIAKALIGHKKGETVTASTPGGAIDFKILDIS